MSWKKYNPENAYAITSQENSLRPLVYLSDFYRLDGYDFGWMLLTKIKEKAKEEKYTSEEKLVSRLPHGLRAIWFWWYLDGQITNGGFIQLFRNGYDRYLPAALISLEEIGEEKSLKVLSIAYEQYLQKEKEFKEAMNASEIVPEYDMYEQFDFFNKFDDDYFLINESTLPYIKKLAVRDPSDYCLDENGASIYTRKNGKINCYFKNGILRDEFQLDDCKLTGTFKHYWETGKLKIVETYEENKKIGTQYEYQKDGALKKSTTFYKTKPYEKIVKYYPDGQRKLLYFKDKKYKNHKYSKEWYANGQLRIIQHYDKKSKVTGDVFKYWDNGELMLHYHRINVPTENQLNFKLKFLNACDYKGNQILKDGNGYYTDVGRFGITKKEIKNGLPHGLAESYKDGLLSSRSTYENGNLEGYRIDYHKDGSIKRKALYQNGKCIERKEFSKGDKRE